MRRVTGKTQDAIQMLKHDHDEVKGLFARFEKAKESAERKSLADRAIEELKIHASVEEEFFYPALRQALEDDAEIMEEADEEHHAAKVLIAELELMSGDEPHYQAKFTVLAENVRHHIKEEEGEMFPRARKTGVDFQALGERMRLRKEQLKAEGVPPDAEHAMVQKVGLRGDSPARRALRSFDAPMGRGDKRRGAMRRVKKAVMGMLLIGGLANGLTAAAQQGGGQPAQTGDVPSSVPPDAAGTDQDAVEKSRGTFTTPDGSGTGTDRTRTGPTGTGAATPPGGAAGGRRSLSDRQANRLVRDAILQDAPASAVTNLKVESKSGKVTLRGIVRSQQEKDAASAKAAAIVGAENVINEITVR